jgi:CPA2 family monovalent cation:H+ antiporter-2
LEAASGYTILEASLNQNLLVAIILSMLLTPLAIAFGPHLAHGASRVPWLNRRLGADPPGVDPTEPHRNHVVVAGYGLAGRMLCRALRKSQVPYIAVDMNPDSVRLARPEGDRVVLGDVTNRELLEEVGCSHARMVVIAINDTRAVLLSLRMLRELAPSTLLLARTQYEADEQTLREAGAHVVVTAETTAGTALVDAASAQLKLVGQPTP